MPELPEVETIRRGLSDFIIKQKIRKITVSCDKSFQGDREQAIGATITDIRRFGKALVIDLDNQTSLLIHLRMTGQLIFDPAGPTADFVYSAGPPPARHASTPTPTRFAAGHPSENFVATLPNRQTRVIIELENGTLYFNDQRKFGFIKSLETTAVKEDSFIKKLAPEPWAITHADFYARLKRHEKAPIKSVILDQTIIAGLGNIYADEALFATKIHPARQGATITEREAKALLESAKAVMEKSIASGGSTMKDYVKADGTRGDYLDKFAQVFNRTGEPCPRCKSTKIVKLRVAGRGTHICPHCQTLKKEPSND